MQTDIDNYDAEADSSVMMTLHSAKGLEFPVVFIAGLEEGVFPSIATMMNPDELNEERRLAYVGITRAKEKLYITKAKSRMLMGHTSYNKVSRFVNEIPPELLNYTGEKRLLRQQTVFPHPQVISVSVPVQNSHLTKVLIHLLNLPLNRVQFTKRRLRIP